MLLILLIFLLLLLLLFINLICIKNISNKMATQISPVIFEEDEIVGFKDKICIIKAIRQAKLGYHLFELTDIDTQATYVSFKHQLSKAVTLPEFDVPADADEMVDVDSHD